MNVEDPLHTSPQYSLVVFDVQRSSVCAVVSFTYGKRKPATAATCGASPEGEILTFGTFCSTKTTRRLSCIYVIRQMR